VERWRRSYRFLGMAFCSELRHEQPYEEKPQGSGEPGAEVRHARRDGRALCPLSARGRDARPEPHETRAQFPHPFRPTSTKGKRRSTLSFAGQRGSRSTTRSWNLANGTRSGSTRIRCETLRQAPPASSTWPSAPETTRPTPRWCPAGGATSLSCPAAPPIEATSALPASSLEPIRRWRACGG